MKRQRRFKSATRQRQQGVILAIGMISMVAILGIIGLALDGGHMLLNKTRLQNIADTAALAGARVYTDNDDVAGAEAAVTKVIAYSAAMSGNGIFQSALSSGQITPLIEFSQTLVPFTPFIPSAAAPARFIRVSLDNMNMDSWFAHIVTDTQLAVSASAVSGPSPSITSNVCDLAPMMICANTPKPYADGTSYGYPNNGVIVLKHAAGDSSPIGPGNFRLLNLPGLQGGKDLRDALANGYDGNCMSVDQVMDTKPGNTVGPVVKGLNARFDQLNGATPPDYDDREPIPALALNDAGEIEFKGGGVYTPDSETNIDPTLTYHYVEYQTFYDNKYSDDPLDNDSPESWHRRLLAVPVMECNGEDAGTTPMQVKGFACIFFVQRVVQKGNEAQVFAQIVSDCHVPGAFKQVPEVGTDPTKVILYKDHRRVDS
ncbi:MAG: Tad domain-containing protein [Pseudomonadales bacterium]|nr:Tad domain-containing protein [Pseudomonadales bacterium]